MHHCPLRMRAAALLLAAPMSAAFAQPAKPAKPAAPTAQVLGSVRPCERVTVDRPASIALGKSTILQLPFPAARVIVGGHSRGTPGTAGKAPPAPPGTARVQDGVADSEATLLGPTELFVVGRRPGAMNLIVQSSDGRCMMKDIVVTMDPSALQAKLGELMPEERGIRVMGADSTLVLAGEVSDLVRLDQALTLAASYVDAKKVVNMLRVAAPQQVMLEVTIAEVSKTVLDRLGLDFSRVLSRGGGSAILSGILGGGAGVIGRFAGPAGSIDALAAGTVGSDTAVATARLSGTARSATLLAIEAQKRDGIIRVLAEPNIMAISGQSASFLSGGKIFIPVAQSRDSGGTTITLEEKEFGVGLRFTPTVLDGSRINLKLMSEASELSQAGSPFTSVNGVTSVLPSISTRRVDTTVQLGDGQSFMVAGLVKNNLNQALQRTPGLGEVPVMGALFRSTEFQADQTELMFIVTPRLVRPLVTAVTLPTDNHIVPLRSEVMLQGAGEGKALPPSAGASAQPAVPAAAAAASNGPVSASGDVFLRHLEPPLPRSATSSLD